MPVKLPVIQLFFRCSVIQLLSSYLNFSIVTISRKKQLRRNPPPKGVKTGKGKEKGDPKRISTCERVKSYPNEEFIVRSSKLFGRAYKEVLALKKVLLSIISSPKNTLVGKKSLHWRVKIDCHTHVGLSEF